MILILKITKENYNIYYKTESVKLNKAILLREKSSMVLSYIKANVRIWVRKPDKNAFYHHRSLFWLCLETTIEDDRIRGYPYVLRVIADCKRVYCIEFSENEGEEKRQYVDFLTVRFRWKKD